MRRRSFRGIVIAAIAFAACRPAKGPDAYGNVEAVEVVVGSQVAGQLQSFTPNEGNTLSAGAIVAVVDSSALVLQLRQAIAQRTAAASHIEEIARQAGVFETQRAIA